MYLAKLTVERFIHSAPELWQQLSTRFRAVHGIAPGSYEVNSWKTSLPSLAEVLALAPANVRECLIFLEYGMPSASTRADILIVGLGGMGQRTGVVVELKQWPAASIHLDGQEVLVGGQVHPHPSDQALGYSEYLADLSVAFSNLPGSLRSCCYLPATLSHAVRHLRQSPFEELTQHSPVFAADQKDVMVKWLSELLSAAPDARFVADLESDDVLISKSLFANVAKAVKEQPAWVLLDSQRIAYREILDLATRDDGEKHVILITGGPGTGKSIIAMQIMGELSRRGIPTVHITNSSSFTTVMKSLIQRRGRGLWNTRAVEGLFRLSHTWVKRKDHFEVALCDEAHRFRLTTNLYPYLISQRPQAEEILENVRVMVAFIDERQRLRRAEAGTVEYFRESALRVGVQPENIHGPIPLTVQFRCAGNADFVNALDAGLYEGRTPGFSHANFEVAVHSSVVELEEHLKKKLNLGYSARLVAGFCWPWSDPEPDGSLRPDVQIGGWQRPWNRKAIDRSYPADRHPYTLWANRTSEELAEIGCIYSVQGFEFDYIGVIWGPDLVRRGHSWVAQPQNSYDGELMPRGRPIDPQEALPLLKNAYRVLSSRGMRGFSVYCMDPETTAFLRSVFGAAD